ncbi:MAG: metalloregulator ArsR/SmtB family transcription factor [Coriobacteriales bacterium]|jgi:ArsR family transcriptional regulator|nr:metalloregulator ArsR/SmtB family transcription factor [Coriobacteriales bacterium]
MLEQKSAHPDCAIGEDDETCCGTRISNAETLYAQAGLLLGDVPSAQNGALPSDTLIYKATEIFSALADSTRFKILSALAAGELCVHELVVLTDVSQSAVSHQLRLLRDRGLLTARRDGQKVVYQFSDEHVRSLILVGLEHAAEQVD